MSGVLIVGGDLEMRAGLRRVLKRGNLQVTGEAGNLRQALRALQSLDPDVVLVRSTSDSLDAVDATAEIMAVKAKPVVVVTDSGDKESADCAFRAMAAGAVAAAVCPNEEDDDAHIAGFLQTVRNMSEVRVVRRRLRKAQPERPAAEPPKEEKEVARSDRRALTQIAVGASTGGPQALQTFLSALPRPLTLPVLVVQHITPEFQSGFAHWLADSTGLRVKLAENKETLRRGHVYIAPHPYHMGVDAHEVRLCRDAPEHGVRPSVSYLFRSLCEQTPRRTAAVLLTGMGRDGAQELRDLRECGALTFAQDAASSVVHGMPGAAIALDGAMYVFPPDEIGRQLGKMMAMVDTSASVRQRIAGDR